MQAIKDYGQINNLYMKSDIEGSEYNSFGRAMLRQNLCSAANKTIIIMEVRTEEAKNSVLYGFNSR